MAFKIGIYNEPAGSGVGGAESMAAVLAEALAAEQRRVDLLHHIPSLTADGLAGASGTDLSGVSLVYARPDHDTGHYYRNPWRRYRVAREWQAELSRPYDLFIAITHNTPPFCHAPCGALAVLFPFDTAAHLRPRAGGAERWPLRQRVEDSYQGWEWKKRMEGYQVKTAISDFSRLWTRRRWGIDCEVVHPPVDNHFGREEKADAILSVGRFALPGEGHTKKQAETLTSFREMVAGGGEGWEYFCVGGLRDSPEHRDYFGRLRALAAGSRAQVLANVERCQLKSLFERASIFWHAAGYEEDEEERPELAEHFGISTVEAMAAGCVPVVINRGGQREIVQHGVNGFLWDTLEELKGYTATLIGDARLRAEMSEAARAQARFFSRERFAKRFLKLLQPLPPGRR